MKFAQQSLSVLAKSDGGKSLMDYSKVFGTIHPEILIYIELVEGTRRAVQFEWLTYYKFNNSLQYPTTRLYLVKWELSSQKRADNF